MRSDSDGSEQVAEAGMDAKADIAHCDLRPERVTTGRWKPEWQGPNFRK